MKMTPGKIKIITKNIEEAIKTDVLSTVKIADEFGISIHITNLRRLLGIPMELRYTEYGNNAEFPIPLALKVRLVRYAVDRLQALGYAKYFIRDVFFISDKALDRLLSGKIPDIAVAFEEYLNVKSVGISDFRQRIMEHYPKLVFTRDGLNSLSSVVDVRSLSYCLINQVKLNRFQMRVLFGLKKEDDALLDKFYL